MTKKRSFIGADGQLITAIEEELPLGIEDNSEPTDPFDHPDDPGPCIQVTFEDGLGGLVWHSPHHAATPLTTDSYWELVAAVHADALLHVQQYGYPTYMLPTRWSDLLRDAGMQLARGQLS